MINNRQAGRRRGRGGNPNGSGNGGGGGNGPRQAGQGRSDNGNRIDNRARGNASQLYEKYKNMATEAQRQGDRVNTEYYHQFADHYFRVLSDQRGRFEEPQQRRQQNDFDGDGDEEFGDEGEPIRNGEQVDAPRQDRQDRPQRDTYRDQREGRPQQDARPGEGRQYQDRPNENRPNENRASENRPNENRSNENRQAGENRPRRWERDERPARAPETETEVAGQHRADPVAAGEDLAVRAETVITADAPLEVAPRRRGRPRREPVVEANADAPAPAESNGFEADRLPPSLSVAATNGAGTDGDAPKPRRRRIRTATIGDVAAD